MSLPANLSPNRAAAAAGRGVPPPPTTAAAPLQFRTNSSNNSNKITDRIRHPTWNETTGLQSLSSQDDSTRIIMNQQSNSSNNKTIQSWNDGNARMIARGRGDRTKYDTTTRASVGTVGSSSSMIGQSSNTNNASAAIGTSTRSVGSNRSNKSMSNIWFTMAGNSNTKNTTTNTIGSSSGGTPTSNRFRRTTLATLFQPLDPSILIPPSVPPPLPPTGRTGSGTGTVVSDFSTTPPLNSIPIMYHRMSSTHSSSADSTTTNTVNNNYNNNTNPTQVIGDSSHHSSSLSTSQPHQQQRSLWFGSSTAATPVSGAGVIHSTVYQSPDIRHNVYRIDDPIPRSIPGTPPSPFGPPIITTRLQPNHYRNGLVDDDDPTSEHSATTTTTTSVVSSFSPPLHQRLIVPPPTINKTRIESDSYNTNVDASVTDHSPDDNDAEYRMTDRSAVPLYNTNHPQHHATTISPTAYFDPRNTIAISKKRRILSKLVTALPDFCCLLAEGPSVRTAAKACIQLQKEMTFTFDPPHQHHHHNYHQVSPRSRTSSVDSNDSSKASSRSGASSSYSTYRKRKSAKSTTPVLPNPLKHLNMLLFPKVTTDENAYKPRHNGPVPSNYNIENEHHPGRPGRLSSTTTASGTPISSRPTTPSFFSFVPAALGGPTASGSSSPNKPFHTISPTDHTSPPPIVGLEHEGEKYLNPFLFYTAAQILFYDLQHLLLVNDDDPNEDGSATTIDSKQSQAHQQLSHHVTLLALFEKCINDLGNLREELCDPFLVGGATYLPPEENIFNNNKTYGAKTQDGNNSDNNATSLNDSNHHIPPSGGSSNRLVNIASLDTIQQGNIPISDPLLEWDTHNTTTAKTAVTTTAIAESLVHSLQQIVAILHAQCRLIELQITLFQDRSGDVVDYNNAASVITVLLSSFHEATNIASATNATTIDDPLQVSATIIAVATQPLVDNFIQEITSWKYLLESCAALERCQFTESMISLRQLQLHLPDKTVDSRWVQWMHQALNNMKSVVPVYMDRIRTMAGPLYGFDTTKLWSNSIRFEVDTIVYDFLSRQQMLGGPETVVTIVVDAEGTGNLNIERGIQFGPVRSSSFSLPKGRATNDGGGGIASTTDNDSLVTWPAVYLRSTIHLISPSAMSNRNSSRSLNPNGSLARGSSSNLLPAIWTTSGASPKSGGDLKSAIGGGILGAIVNSPRTRGKTSSSTGLSNSNPYTTTLSVSSSLTGSGTTPLFQPSIFEYAPDSGSAASWPHCEWDTLASVVNALNDERSTIRGFPQEYPVLTPIVMTPTEVTPGTRSKHWWFLSLDQSDDNINKNKDTAVVTESNKRSENVNLTTAGNEYLSKRPNNYATLSCPTSTTTPHGAIHVFKRPETKTIFHVSTLSKWINLVVMVEDEATGDDTIVGTTWTRHFTTSTVPTMKGLEHSEIQLFLETMTAKLCIPRLLFSSNAIRSVSNGGVIFDDPVQQKHHKRSNSIIDDVGDTVHRRRSSNNSKDTSLLPTPVLLKLPVLPHSDHPMETATAFWTNEDVIENFLLEVKEVFGLYRSRYTSNPSSPSILRDSFRSYYASANNPGSAQSSPSTTPLSTRKRMWRQQQLQLHQNKSRNTNNPFSLNDDSAIMTLFLGPDLATIFD